MADKRPLMNMRPQDIKALGAGLELAMVIGGMAYGGHWLDERWGTDPWMTMVGLFVGIFGGSWHTIKVFNGGKLPDFGFNAAPGKKTAPGSKAPGAQTPGSQTSGKPSGVDSAESADPASDTAGETPSAPEAKPFSGPNDRASKDN